MKITSKWFFTIAMPWLGYIGSCVFATRYGFPPIEQRIIYTLGTLLLMGIMLLIVQPWRPDSEKTRR